MHTATNTTVLVVRLQRTLSRIELARFCRRHPKLLNGFLEYMLDMVQVRRIDLLRALILWTATALAAAPETVYVASAVQYVAATFVKRPLQCN